MFRDCVCAANSREKIRFIDRLEESLEAKLTRKRVEEVRGKLYGWCDSVTRDEESCVIATRRGPPRRATHLKLWP